jgi:ATP-dependent protease ClpP protease subunit
MLILAADNKQQPIIIDVESNGGPIRDALAIIRTMNGVPCPVATFCRGPVNGSAIVIAAHGKKGFRVSDPGVHFTIPAGLGLNSSGEMEKLGHTLIQLLSNDTGRSEDEILNWLENGFEFGVEGARAAGVIDVVGTKPIFPGF